MAQKPYQSVTIAECDEPLVPIPLTDFAVATPHPYEKLGAPYQDKSPYYLRQGVLERLRSAQIQLQQRCPGWRIQIFDAYRPIAVQQFMVDYTFHQLVQAQNLIQHQLTEMQRQAILQQVYEFWAPPSLDPATPPPHSTGAAIDITLVDANGIPVEMGSAIDEISPRSYPDHFANRPEPEAQRYHHHRQLLRHVMQTAEFQQHPKEWWHFSYGDQLWAWLVRQINPQAAIARYGGIQ